MASTVSAGKRLVVFGCGYVGSALAQQARDRGLQVTALTRNAANADILREQGILTVVADLSDGRWHHQIPGGADYVLNCVSAADRSPAGYHRSYLRGMASILEWSRCYGSAGTLIYTSSTSVYPQGGGVEVNESAATPRDLASERAKILIEAEDALRASEGAVADRWFILRLAGIYGPGRHRFLDQARAGEVSGDPATRLNLVHRDDIVSAIWSCFFAPASVRNEVFNVVDNAPSRRDEIVGWVAAQLSLPQPRFVQSEAAVRREQAPDRVISNGKIRTLLGWQPGYPTFREGYANFLSP